MICKSDLIREQVKNNISLVKKNIYTKINDLYAVGYLIKEPVPFAERKTGEYRELKVGDQWGKLFDCAWFHITGTVPLFAKGKKIVLIIDINGEGCVYDGNGYPIRGITNVASEFDRSLGMPGKRVLQFSECSTGEEKVDLWIDAGYNDLFGKFQGDGKIIQMDIATCNDNARDLYYDMTILDDMLDCIDQNNARYYSILYALQNAVNHLSDFKDEEYLLAKEALNIELNKIGGTPSLSFHAVGHGHIDLAWLWPIRETKRKCVRTISTTLELMERYPDYIFGASQPQLFEWIEQDHPMLFEKIKQKVKEGRIELQGGMWVESDTNIPSGESLVRQFLYGKRYFREHFNVDVKNLWLPDAFGYSAALPQIIKKSDCNYFLTTKLSWNLINKFPFHTFNWVGIDGSQVLTHIPPEGVYNSASLPHSYIKAQKEYCEKGICNQALCLFGIGDGGGGPGPEHLERLKRLKNLDGIPPVKQTPAYEFFDEISANKNLYKSYKGELYLEKHQGTFTSQAKNKKMNRELENKLHTTELLLTQAYLKNNLNYPHDKLNEIWKEVLLYQFHDILPGSSIKRVYDESLERYELLSQKIDGLRKLAIDNLSQAQEKSIYNPLPWQRKKIIKSSNEYFELTVPGFSFQSISKANKIKYPMYAVQNCLENDLVRVTLNENGFITSIYDKQCNKECIPDGKIANELVLFTDNGDAWDFPLDYRHSKKAVFELQEQKYYSDDCYAIMSNVYRYNRSTIYQDIILQGGTKLIDFKTRVEWHEKNKMLRAEFPVNIFSDIVNCDIQFGNLKRSVLNNNSIEIAQSEIVAHKWIDLSQVDYGVALLNNCKYGYFAKNNIISINLLRSQNYPCSNQDEGNHEFSYAFFPHNGSLYESNVEKEAYEYNYPVLCEETYGNAPFIAECDKNNIIIETVKLSEDNDGIIIRLYENKGKSSNCNIRLHNEFTKCTLTNLIEDTIEDINITNNNVNLNFKPFEVHTLKVI